MILVLILLLTSLSALASPSSTLADLKAKGVSETGGTALYGHYIPRLGPEGKLDISLLPNGSGFTETDPVWEAWKATFLPAYITTNSLHTFESDPKFTAWYDSTSGRFITADEVPAYEKDSLFFEWLGTNTLYTKFINRQELASTSALDRAYAAEIASQKYPRAGGTIMGDAAVRGTFTSNGELFAKTNAYVVGDLNVPDASRIVFDDGTTLESELDSKLTVSTEYPVNGSISITGSVSSASVNSGNIHSSGDITAEGDISSSSILAGPDKALVNGKWEYTPHTNSPGNREIAVIHDISRASEELRSATREKVDMEVYERENDHWTWTSSHALCPSGFISGLNSYGAPKPVYTTGSGSAYWGGVNIKSESGELLYACEHNTSAGPDSLTVEFTFVKQPVSSGIVFTATASRSSATNTTPVTAHGDEKFITSSALKTKQDILVAGENITISNNVISSLAPQGVSTNVVIDIVTNTVDSAYINSVIDVTGKRDKTDNSIYEPVNMHWTWASSDIRCPAEFIEAINLTGAPKPSYSDGIGWHCNQLKLGDVTYTFSYDTDATPQSTALHFDVYTGSSAVAFSVVTRRASATDTSLVTVDSFAGSSDVSRKQDRLVAGDNIVIRGNTISAIPGGMDMAKRGTMDLLAYERVNEHWVWTPVSDNCPEDLIQALNEYNAPKPTYHTITNTVLWGGVAIFRKGKVIYENELKAMPADSTALTFKFFRPDDRATWFFVKASRMSVTDTSLVPVLASDLLPMTISNGSLDLSCYAVTNTTYGYAVKDKNGVEFAHLDSKGWWISGNTNVVYGTYTTWQIINRNMLETLAVGGGNSGSVDKDEVKGIIHDTINSDARPYPKYLHVLDFYDSYPEDAKWYYDQQNTPGGCSARRTGSVFERNYDWYYDDSPAFVTMMHAGKGRFASVGISNVGTNMTEDFVNSGKESRYYKCLPGHTVDGVNEMGVAVTVNVVVTNGSPWETHTPGRDINSSGAVRWVLDHATSAGMAASNLASRVYISDSLKRQGFSVHFMIVDTKETWIVEDGECYIETTGTDLVSLPFVNTRAYSEDIYGSGLERSIILFDRRNSITNAWYSHTYDTGWPWPSEFAHERDAEGYMPNTATARLRAWAQTYIAGNGLVPPRRNTGLWHTVHTSIYDVSNKTMRVSVDEKDDWYTFAVPQVHTSGGGGGGITEEVDPTVPDWAKSDENPSYTKAQADERYLKLSGGVVKSDSGGIGGNVSFGKYGPGGLKYHTYLNGNNGKSYYNRDGQPEESIIDPRYELAVQHDLSTKQDKLTYPTNAIPSTVIPVIGAGYDYVTSIRTNRIVRDTASPTAMSSGAYGNGKWVVAERPGATADDFGQLMTSVDYGRTWTRSEMPKLVGSRGMAYNPNTDSFLVAASAYGTGTGNTFNGTIVEVKLSGSGDVISAVPVATNDTDAIYDIAIGRNTILAAGWPQGHSPSRNGVGIFYTCDMTGHTGWTALPSSKWSPFVYTNSAFITSACCDGNTTFVVGRRILNTSAQPDASLLYCSTNNGQTWAACSYPEITSLESNMAENSTENSTDVRISHIRYGNGRFVAIIYAPTLSDHTRLLVSGYNDPENFVTTDVPGAVADVVYANGIWYALPVTSDDGTAYYISYDNAETWQKFTYPSEPPWSVSTVMHDGEGTLVAVPADNTDNSPVVSLTLRSELNMLPKAGQSVDTNSVIGITSGILSSTNITEFSESSTNSIAGTVLRLSNFLSDEYIDRKLRSYDISYSNATFVVSDAASQTLAADRCIQFISCGADVTSLTFNVPEHTGSVRTRDWIVVVTSEGSVNPQFHADFPSLWGDPSLSNAISPDYMTVFTFTEVSSGVFIGARKELTHIR